MNVLSAEDTAVHAIMRRNMLQQEVYRPGPYGSTLKFMEMAMHTCALEVRSYELDAFGHVNHAVYLNYFEYARFRFLEAAGFPPAEIMERDQGIHVVRVEVDYRRELRLGDPLEIRTRVDTFRNTSMTLLQEARAPEGPVFAEAKVVIVWVGADGRPTRIPDDIRSGLAALDR